MEKNRLIITIEDYLVANGVDPAYVDDEARKSLEEAFEAGGFHVVPPSKVEEKARQLLPHIERSPNFRGLLIIEAVARTDRASHTLVKGGIITQEDAHKITDHARNNYSGSPDVLAPQFAGNAQTEGIIYRPISAEETSGKELIRGEARTI